MKVEIKKIEGIGTISIDENLDIFVNDVKKAGADYFSNDVLIFSYSNIKNEKGTVNGIRLESGVKLIVENLIESKKQEKEAKESALIAEDTKSAMSANIISFKYGMGCDTSDTISFDYNYANSICYEAKTARDEKDKKVLKAIEKIPAKKIGEIKKMGNVTELEAGFFSYGGYETSDKKVIDALIEEAKKIIAKEDDAKKVKAKEIEKNNALDEKRKAVQEKAKISHRAEFVRVIGHYDADEEDNGKDERGMATVSEYIDEFGTITEKTDYAY